MNVGNCPTPSRGRAGRPTHARLRLTALALSRVVLSSVVLSSVVLSSVVLSSVVLLPVVLLSGCAKKSESTSAGTTPDHEPSKSAQAEKAPSHRKVLGGGVVSLGAPPERVSNALVALKMGLKARLQTAMKAGGPVAALAACQLHAGPITAKAQAAGVWLGRTSHRLRNPANAAPAWAKKYVEESANKRLDKVPARMTVDLKDGKKGYLEMIGTAGMCLACHGPSADLDPKLKVQLAKRYPNDKATGFRRGDVRGWFWATYQP